MSSVQSSPARSHKRADTYEGPQLTFQFPSTADLAKHEEKERVQGASPTLSGPPMEPYYKTHLSPKSPRFHEDASSDIHQISTSSQVSGSSFVISDTDGTIPSIPTRSNISYQITENISNGSVQGQLPPPPPPHQHQNQHQTPDQQQVFQFPQASMRMAGKKPTPSPLDIQNTFQQHHHNQTKSLPDSPDKFVVDTKGVLESPLARQASVRRVGTTIKRTASVRSSKNSDHSSLFSKSTLKRSKAIKHKIGWLSRLKFINQKLYTKLKQSWKSAISKSKNTVIKFKTRFNRTKAVEKARISLPLERQQGRTIEELKHDMSQWYVAENTVKVPPVPPVHQSPSQIFQSRQRITSLASIQNSIDKIRPPPSDFPRNRITSNPMIQRYVRQEELKKRLSSAPMTLTEHHYNHPTSLSSKSSSSNILMKGDEALVYEYLKVYLANVIAQRINHKLELYDQDKAKNRESIPISVPELEQDNESLTGSEYSAVHSEYDTQFTLSDYEGDSDDENEEDKVKEPKIVKKKDNDELQSEVSTVFYSVYQDEMLNETLSKYQQTYVSGSLKRKGTINVKRSSTLPDNVKFKNYLQNNEIKIKNDIMNHTRYLSVV